MPYHDHGVEGSQKNTRRITITRREIEEEMKYLGAQAWASAVLFNILTGDLSGKIATAAEIAGIFEFGGSAAIASFLKKSREKQLNNMLEEMRKQKRDSIDAIGTFRYQGKNKGYVLVSVTLS